MMIFLAVHLRTGCPPLTKPIVGSLFPTVWLIRWGAQSGALAAKISSLICVEVAVDMLALSFGKRTAVTTAVSRKPLYNPKP